MARDALISVSTLLHFLTIIYGILVIIITIKKIDARKWVIYISIGFVILLIIFIGFTYLYPEICLPNSKLYVDFKPPRATYNKGLFQDFDDNEDLVDKLWADPGAELYRGGKKAEINCFLEKNNKTDRKHHLKTIFKSHGYGANITIRCKDSIPADSSKANFLYFHAQFIPEKKSEHRYLGLKIRIFDRDGEVWYVGTRGIDYEYGTDPKPDVEIPANLGIREYKFNLDMLLKFPKKFKHDGNALGGDKSPSLESVSRITFDLLPRSIEGVMIIDNIRFE